MPSTAAGHRRGAGRARGSKQSGCAGQAIDTLNVDEAGTVGSLMLAGLATGEYASLEQAAGLVHTVRRLEPAENRDRYAPIYARYRRVYDAMRTVYAD